MSQATYPIEPLPEGVHEGYVLESNVNMRHPIMLNTIDDSDNGPNDRAELPYINASYYLKISNTSKTVEEYMSTELARMVLANHTDIAELHLSKRDLNLTGMFNHQDEGLPDIAKGIYLHPTHFYTFVIWCAIPEDLAHIAKVMRF